MYVSAVVLFSSCSNVLAFHQILKDEKKRAAFDQYGSTSQQPGFDPNAFSAGFGGGFGRAGGFPGFGQTGRGGGGDLFEQLFNSFNGGASRQSGIGESIQTNLNISFMEACKGTKKKVTITAVDECSPCNSSGLKPGVSKTTCSSCKGTGTRTFVIDSGFQMASTCPTCSGEGTIIPRGGECGSCGGGGKVRVKKTVQVIVPNGQFSLSPVLHHR